MNVGKAAAVLHERSFGASAVVIGFAPGRVNLIGEHTDYNDGYVLPMAIPFGTAVALSPTRSRRVEAVSERFSETAFELDGEPTSTVGWGRYLHGMHSLLRREGIEVGGFTAAVASDIPGSSLSSSAALEVAAGTALAALAGVDLEPITMARTGQRVEHEVIGVPVGIMDQLISATAVAGAASLIDCRSLDIEPVPLPDTARIVVLDTGTRRGLVDSEYAARRAACERAAKALGVTALRDATLEGVERMVVDETDRRRARHVVTENSRVIAAAKAAGAGDIASLGRLMTESHESLHLDFEVTGPAPHAAVELARTLPGVRGARMTGAGFAGAAIALVDHDAVEDFVATMRARFVAPSSQPSTEEPGFHVVWPVSGAHVIQPRA